jgi:hypothetical protein
MAISTNRIHKKFELRELTKMNNGLSIMRCQRNIVEIMNLCHKFNSGNKQIGEETPWWSRERETGSERRIDYCEMKN